MVNSHLDDSVARRKLALQDDTCFKHTGVMSEAAP